jgi:hypothetical protein
LQDWDYHASKILSRKNEWINLDYFKQSEWRTTYYNLPPEKFKNIVWNE